MFRVFTRKLVLRQITEDDLEQLSQWSCSPEAYGDYLSPEYLTYEECYERLKNNTYWNDHSRRMIIALRDVGKSIGTIRFWQKLNDYTTAMVALKIAEPEFRGKGHGTEAQLGMIHHLFTSWTYKTVEMMTDLDNVPQQRCLEKLGFTFIDVQTYEDKKVQRQGRLYRLSRDEYKLRFQELFI